jgi:mono/diheme cytochrome c family protein
MLSAVVAAVASASVAVATIQAAAAPAPRASAQREGSAGQGPAGRDLFLRYCASCHGASGQGNGPIAPQLRRVPADVTRYALENGGKVPTARLHRLIDGRDVGSHGTFEMPVWGDAFKSTDGGLTPEQVRDRIAALVSHIESIQRRNAH